MIKIEEKKLSGYNPFNPSKKLWKEIVNRDVVYVKEGVYYLLSYLPIYYLRTDEKICNNILGCCTGH